MSQFSDVVWETFYKDVKISVVHNDLTLEKVTAIVNAANEDLSNGGGLAGAIRKAAGEFMQSECDSYISQYSKLPTGENMVTSGGRLACTHIIHTVGPIFQDGSSGEDDLLFNSIYGVLIRANAIECESVAIPAVSSGIYRFPKDRCARIIVTTVKDFVDRNSSGSISLKRIRLTNFDMPTVEEMKRKCIEIFENKNSRNVNPNQTVNIEEIKIQEKYTQEKNNVNQKQTLNNQEIKNEENDSHEKKKPNEENPKKKSKGKERDKSKFCGCCQII